MRELLGSLLRSSTRSTYGLSPNSGHLYSNTCDHGIHFATTITSWTGIQFSITSSERKRKRTYSQDSDLPLPSWTNLLDKPSRLRLQVRAKKSMARAIG